MSNVSRISALTVSSALIALISLPLACGDRDKPAVTTVQSAITTTFALPVVIGFNPNDIALGASQVATVNDRARILANSGASDSLVSLGATGTTNIGVGSIVGRIWSAPNLLLRSSRVNFYKTAGTATVQAGTTFNDPTENRSSVPVHQDPLWAVTLTAPSTGQAISVASQQTRSIAPGNYGATIVNSGGTLRLNAAGDYGFVSLDLEPGAIVQVTSPGGTSVFVNSGLILRAPLGGAGMILAYLGSNAAAVESSFTGDLFLAPNADISIKANSTGHFFGRNLTVFEGFVVTVPALSSRSVTFVRPTATITFPVPSTQPSDFDPQQGMAEIATAIMTPGPSSACAADTAFVSHQNNRLSYRTVSSIGSGTPATAANLQPPAPPPACIGTSLVGQTYPWPVLAGGRPFYRDNAGTDNVMTRLDGARIVMVGSNIRWCEDPSTGVPQGPGCPATQPANGGACDPTVTTGACVYGATPGTQCTCQGTTFSCGPLERQEGHTLTIWLTTDCGANWTAAAFDAWEVGIGDGTNKDGDFDRWETYFDPFDKKLYISSHTGPNPQLQVVYWASTIGITDARNLVFQQLTTSPAISPQPWDSTPQVMTSILDERALMPDGSYGRWVHFVRARCTGATVVLDVVSPFGLRSFNLVDPTDSSTICGQVGNGQSGMPLAGIHWGPSVVGISSTPPRVQVAYTGVTAAGFEIVNLVTAQLRTSQGYGAGPLLSRKTIDKSSASQHVMFPQLIRADSLVGSNLLVDAPVILRYTAWSGDAVSEYATAAYSGLYGPEQLLASWSVSSTFGMTAATCATNAASPDPSLPRCFAGDYRYGTFYKKSGSTLTFFAPWTGQSTNPGTTTGVFAHGATIDIRP